MRLRLSRPYHQWPRPRAQNTATGQPSSSTNKRHRGGNAFQKLMGRCRLPCVRCGGGDTASLVSDLQYHSLLATPVYLPRRLGSEGQGETSDGSEVEEEVPEDRRVEEEQEQDTDLSMFSQGWDDTRDLYLTCNRNSQDSQEAGDSGPTAQATRLYHPQGESRCTRPSHLTQRINTNFIPLAFNSHRSWLDRIHLGNSLSSSDDFSHLLEVEDDDLAEGDQEEDSEGGYLNEANSPSSSRDLNLTQVDHTTTTGIGTELNGNGDTTLAHTLHLDYDTLNPSQNTVWMGPGTTNTSSSDGDQLDTLSTNSSRSFLLIDFLNDLDVTEENVRTVPDVASNNSVASRTDSHNQPEAILHSTCSSVVEPPSETLPTEQTSDEEEEDTMPESLRFLFQPLSTPSHTHTTVVASEPRHTPMASMSVSQASLAGYGNRPSSNLPGSSGGSSQSSSLVNLQQNWYIYDPRLHPLHRQQERLQVEMRWRGVRTALSMPAMIGPPDYDDLSSHHDGNHDDNNHAITLESPPPYADRRENYHQVATAPPPTYAEAVLESLFTDPERREWQGYPGESRDRNLLPSTPTPGLREDHANRINSSYNDADDLDTNVILSTTLEEDTDELPTSARSNSFDIDDNRGEWQSGGRLIGASPTQALQAGFLCSRGRPAVAWNRQRWGETGNQSNFGINCRLQGVDGSRF